MKKRLRLFLGYIFIIAAHWAIAQPCNTTYAPIKEPAIKKSILFQSKSTVNLKTLTNKSQVGQSFLATAPYLKKITTDFTKPAGSVAGDVTVKLYVYDSDNHPTHRDRVIWQTSISINSWNNVIIPTTAIYIKPGLQYYISFENLSLFPSLNYKRDYNPHGVLYINGIKNIERDLNIEIEGGYPMEGYKDLMVYNYLSGSNSRNFQCREIGQTFIATTPYIKSIKLTTGANPSGEKAIVRIFEFDEAKNRRTFKQIGEACSAVMGYYATTIFDWETSGLAMPHLKVGKKYYLEATKEKTDEYNGGPTNGSYTAFHVYSNSVNMYDYGEMYTDGKAETTNDLYLEIVGLDPNAKKELVVNTMNPSDNAWLVWYPAVGQTFKATTSYINSVTGNFCNPSTVNLRIYKFSGAADPRGVLIKEVLNIAIWVCGPTVVDFPPIPTLPGQDYYVEFSSINYATNLSVYGAPYKNKDNYDYGNTYFRTTSGTYQISTQPGPVNITINGVKTGMPYIGWGVGINDHSGFDFSATYAPYSLRFNHLVNAIQNKAIAYNDIGAYWVRFALPIGDSLMNNLQLTDAFFEHLEDKNIGGVIWILGYDGTLPSNETSWEFSEDFYNQAEIYATRAAILAERYKGCNIIWEVLNEPYSFFQSGGGTNSISTRQLSYLAQLTSKKIKAVDPSACIGSGGISHLSNWMPNETIANDIGDYIDIFNYHPYFQPMPENALENWTKNLRLEFAKVTKNFHVPTFVSSEFGAGQNEWTSASASSITTIRDNGYYENTPYMYYVHTTGANTYNTGPKFAGQTFKGTGQSIKWISLNIGSVNSGMRLSLYKYSGNPLSPRGTLLGTVDQTGIAPQYGFADFKFTNSPITLQKDVLYYVEFFKTDNTALHVYGNNYPTTGINEYVKYKAGPTVDFDGQAYSWNGSGNYTALPGDLNMKIWKAGMVNGASIYEEGPFVNTLICNSSYGPETRLVGPYSEAMQAVYNSRYLLNQLKNNVPLSIVYKEGDDQSYQGVFYPDRWLSAFVFTYQFYKKYNANMIKNLSKYFRESFSEATMTIFVSNPAITNYVAKYDEITKTLVVAVWQAIPAESSGYHEAATVAIRDVTFATQPVTVNVYNGIINPVMGQQTGISLDNSSGTVLNVNNITVGAEPVIVTIKLP